MAATMDGIQTLQQPAGHGPRFRPFASSVHHVTKGRYITSNDPRGYIPVYEYPLNSQWIMMDIDDGYILWTGIWKALGNSKADIVKMIDSQPELAQVIRRVRGGYLKIQGTWMPYETALRLARRVAWNIREDLVPLFGPTFPSTCLSPDQPGYGQVVASSGRRRARRHQQPPLMSMISSPDNRPLNGQQVSLHQPSLLASASSLSNTSGAQYSSIYPVDAQIHSPPEHFGQARPQHRYTPYPTPASAIPPSRKLSAASSRGSLSLDIPGLSLHDEPRNTPSPVRPVEQIKLPAIQQQPDSPPLYALPPISALEDLRGVDTQDSAAVLRRLQSDDDDSYSESSQTHEQRRPNRRPLSAPTTKKTTLSTFPMHRHSLGQIPLPSSRKAYEKLCVSVPPDCSRDGDSTCDPSPISPATPRSAGPGRDQLALVPLSVLKEQSRTAAPYSLPVTFHNDWLTDGLRPDNDSRISACRYSCMEDSSDSVPLPLTSW